MHEPSVKTVLCVASYEKGQEFLRECKRQGCKVILLSVTALEHGDWPWESIDESFYMPALDKIQDVINGVCYLARTRQIDHLVPLDDYDVQTVAGLREHLRIPGMGDTTARYFRDKLAMRQGARDAGILVPDFVHVLNYDRIREFTERVPPPWVLKPRSEASSIGIKKVHSNVELWPLVEGLGDRQSYYVLERYVPGAVYHVDSIVSEREVVFAEVHAYQRPPMDVFQAGGVFVSRTLPRDSDEAVALREMHAQVIAALGLVRGVTHMEFIRGDEDGRYYFLETAARVGGAHITEMVEAATGTNLWAEWAKIEVWGSERPYAVPEHRNAYAGIAIALARQEFPDTSAYTDPEIVWRMKERHHAGLLVTSEDPDRVSHLLAEYSRRFQGDFVAVLPPWEGRPDVTTMGHSHGEGSDPGHE